MYNRSAPPYHISRTPKPAPTPKPSIERRVELAVDAALRSDPTRVSRAAVKTALDAAMPEIRASLAEGERARKEAEAAVLPFVGEIPPQNDAEAVYREALRRMGNADADTIPSEALAPIFQAMPLPGKTPAEDRAIRGVLKQMAEDAAKPQPSFEERFPNAARLMRR